MQTRVDKKRTANALLKTSREGKDSNMGATAEEALKNSYQSKSSNKFSSTDTIEIMERRKNPQTEITNKDLEDMVNKGKDDKEAVKVEE